MKKATYVEPVLTKLSIREIVKALEKGKEEDLVSYLDHPLGYLSAIHCLCAVTQLCML